ncbi:EARP and GARP complex-interacting protein 1-like isoform X2 [Dreissena polymorpha]|uniref:EARP and GARP complex-interacting protein 1-like isoform X2 n=1 Tax=Dreissena polymorpha TaxID=45954 RepID=UPI00226554DD|nr:EARP and GARP complex-interacting protein 1-like isoform X2 [Dreissena polymorpha]
MEDEAPVIYGLEFPARALCAQAAEADQIRFLVGTQSLRQENQVHHIDFDDENNVINKNVFTHREGEIWHMSASTLDKSHLATCYNKTSESRAEMKAAIWKLPSDFDDISTEDQSSMQPLQLVCRLEANDLGDIKSVMWHPTGDGCTIVGLADSHIVLWDIDTNGSSAKMSSSAGLEAKGQPRMTCCSWDPHHNCVQIATANDTCIRGWDIRNMQQTYVIDNAHGQLVRDLDFNPNKQYYLLSCGDDCKVKFWDVRNVTEPLKVLSDHSHWARLKLRCFHCPNCHVFIVQGCGQFVTTGSTTSSSSPRAVTVAWSSTTSSRCPQNRTGISWNVTMRIMMIRRDQIPRKTGLLRLTKNTRTVYTQWTGPRLTLGCLLL